MGCRAFFRFPALAWPLIPTLAEYCTKGHLLVKVNAVRGDRSFLQHLGRLDAKHAIQ